MMIDGLEAHPMDVRDLRGTPLHTVVDAEGLQGRMLKLFTEAKSAEAYAKNPPKPKKIANAPTSASRSAFAKQRTAKKANIGGPGYIDLYEHVDWAGCNWRLLEENARTVRNYADLWACGFLWWGWKNANNTVSAVDVRIEADWITFFDAPDLDFGNFSNTLWLPGDAWVPNLVPFGWNDRISSHMVWYLG